MLISCTTRKYLFMIRDYKHWVVVDTKDNWAYIQSPTASSGVIKETGSFRLKREVYLELGLFSADLEKDGYVGWITDTYIENAVIMKTLKIFGAQPYKIDDNLYIWFARRF